MTILKIDDVDRAGFKEKNQCTKIMHIRVQPSHGNFNQRCTLHVAHSTWLMGSSVLVHFNELCATTGYPHNGDPFTASMAPFFAFHLVESSPQTEVSCMMTSFSNSCI